MAFSIFGAFFFAVVVGVHAMMQVFGDAGVEGIVLAAEYVDVVHGWKDLSFLFIFVYFCFYLFYHCEVVTANEHI